MRVAEKTQWAERGEELAAKRRGRGLSAEGSASTGRYVKYFALSDLAPTHR